VLKISQEMPVAETNKRVWQGKQLLIVDIIVLLIMGFLLFWGTSTQFSNPFNDMTRYQCYALAFWQGQAGVQSHGLQATSQSQCSFLMANSSSDPIAQTRIHHLPSLLNDLANSQSNTQAFHALPPEYPFLTLIPFSIPLLAPFAWYQTAFSLLMTLVAILIYALLVTYQSRPAALAFAFYLVLGNWASGTDRFDLVVVAFIVGAILLANKRHWKWAFALLALATLAKFYPVVLALPFLLAQQAQYKGEKWLAWRRWSGLSVFVGLGALVMLISLLSNINATIIPFLYFRNRPFEIGSLPASLIWISAHLGLSAQANMDYQSLNLTSSLARFISPSILLLEIAGFLSTFWLQWRRKLTLAEACLLTTLVIIITGKVFSPQYLIWVTPLIALVGQANWKWVLTWGLVCALTTFMFPFHFNSFSEIYAFLPATIVRNLLILTLVCCLLYAYNKRTSNAVTTVAAFEQG
jgi:hypothetical protein